LKKRGGGHVRTSPRGKKEKKNQNLGRKEKKEDKRGKTVTVPQTFMESRQKKKVSPVH